MKIIIVMLMLIELIVAAVDLEIDVNAEQNIRALYKDINLTKEQKEYIVDSEEQNINAINKILAKEISSNNKIKNIDDKNIIQFELNQNGIISDIKMLSKSNYKELDIIAKSTIQKVNNMLVIPKEKIILRYIIKYNIKNKNNKVIYKNTENNYKSVEKNNEIPIKRGTTHFKYNSQEYSRVFNTNQDGFINVSQEPTACAKRISILTYKGQSIAEASGVLFSRINKEASKGKYEILIQTKQDCNINLQYP